jgi:dTDP-glucose 4,6-dehydratase
VKILVTGGAGFIGSHFIRLLLTQRADVEIVNVDKLTYAANLNNLSDIASRPQYSFARADVCDPFAIDRALSGCAAVVHFAAESHVDRSIYNPLPALQTNINGTLNLLQTARTHGVERFVHVSTDEVYGDIPGAQVASESSPLQPNSPYAASKAGADLLVRSFVKTYGFPAIVVRPSNNYGPNQFPEKFLPLMISNALEGQPLPLYGDGAQQRSWNHVHDTCAAIQSVLERGCIGETYNVGGATVETNLSMALRVLKHLGLPETLVQHVEDRPGHDRRYALNSEKIRKETGWTPTTELADGLANTIEWYRKNAQWLEEVKRGEYQSYYEKYYANRGPSLESVRRGARSSEKS